VTPQPNATDEADANGTILLVCRDPRRRAMVERLVQPIEAHPAAMDALLAVARKTPRALLLNLEDLAGSEQEVLAAIRRHRPDVPVGILVAPEDEPRGRKLVAEGAAEYFVLPNDAGRLPTFLHPEARPPPAPAAAGDRRATHLFRAACELAELATSQPQPLFRDGAMLILRALGARQGRAFSSSLESGNLEPVAVLGEGAADDATRLRAERAAAERTLRTGEVLLIEAGTTGAPAGGLLCVPVRQGGTVFGILCLSGKTDASPLDQDDRNAAAALADVLAHLYRSALLRSEYARLALRDARTGLLKADPFLTCLESQIARAEDQGGEVGLVLLEPPAGHQAQDAEALERLGTGIRAALEQGWEAGRLETGAYAVAVPHPARDEPPGEAAEDFYRAAAAHLADVGRQANAGPLLRTALAVFPRDGTTAKTLVAAAQARLAAPA